MTPHAISLLDKENRVVAVLQSEGIARAASTRLQTGSIRIGDAEVPVNQTSFGDVTGLPEPMEGHAYVVSVLTAQAVAGREDVFITDDAVRDDAGRIIGCRALARV